MEDIVNVLQEITTCAELARRRSVLRLANEFPDIKTSYNQNQLIYMLSRNPDITCHEIALKMHISKSAITQLVQSMIKHGLISKHKNSNDHRCYKLKLTKKSLDYRQSVVDEMKKMIAGALQNKTNNTDLKSFIKIHRLLKEHCDKLID